MSLSSLQLRRLVRRTLLERSEAASSSRPPLASAFNTLCERLRDRFQPLFGATAVAALFARAVHVATLEFPWLADVIGKNGDRCSADVIAALQGVDMDHVEEGLAAVLAHDIELLRAFVGDDLILPLVRHAWGVALAEDLAGPRVCNE
jgi:hypothetical protein